MAKSTETDPSPPSWSAADERAAQEIERDLDQVTDLRDAGVIGMQEWVIIQDGFQRRLPYRAQQRRRHEARFAAHFPNSTCRWCGHVVVDIGSGGPLWRHVDTQGDVMAGCRAASYVAGAGWDDGLDRRWKAAPERGAR
jgi:hypothetical protein